MKNSHLAISTTLIFIFLISPKISNAEDSFTNKLKEFIQSNNEYEKFRKEFGFPIWNKMLEKSFGTEKLAIVPIIDYANSYANGVLFFVEKENIIKYKYISRDYFFKHFVNKKKSRSLPYRNSVIASFLKFDLSIYNFIERETTREISLTKGSEAKEIVELVIEAEVLDFVLQE